MKAKIKSACIDTGVLLVCAVFARLIPVILVNAYELVTRFVMFQEKDKNYSSEGICIIISFFVLLAMSVIYINMKRKKFSFDDTEKQWNEKKKWLLISNAIIYFVISLPTNVYFLIAGVDNVYAEAADIAGFSGINAMYEPGILRFFFSPQIAFFRLTKSYILGFLLNLVIYLAITSFFIARKPKDQSTGGSGNGGNSTKKKRKAREEKAWEPEF